MRWSPRPGPPTSYRTSISRAKLAYAGHVLLDNRHGLVTNVCVTAATEAAEHEAALLLLALAARAGRMKTSAACASGGTAVACWWIGS